MTAERWDARAREAQMSTGLHEACGGGDRFDRYGHLMPGGEAEAEDLLDAYLEKAMRR